MTSRVCAQCETRLRHVHTRLRGEVPPPFRLRLYRCPYCRAGGEVVTYEDGTFHSKRGPAVDCTATWRRSPPSRVCKELTPDLRTDGGTTLGASADLDALKSLSNAALAVERGPGFETTYVTDPEDDPFYYVGTLDHALFADRDETYYADENHVARLIEDSRDVRIVPISEVPTKFGGGER